MAKNFKSALDKQLQSGAMNEQKLLMGDIRIHQDLQVRVDGVDEPTAQGYAEAILAGDEFPPVVVFKVHGQHWLVAGFHRHRAHEIAEQQTIRAEVRTGNWDDALEFAEDDNLKNARQLSTEDKRGIFEARFDRRHEWFHWSDGRIAGALAVDRKTVGNWRAEWEAATGEFSPLERVGSDGRTRSVERVQEVNSRPSAAYTVGNVLTYPMKKRDGTILYREKATVENVRWDDDKASWMYKLAGVEYVEDMVEPYEPPVDRPPFAVGEIIQLDNGNLYSILLMDVENKEITIRHYLSGKFKYFGWADFMACSPTLFDGDLPPLDVKKYAEGARVRLVDDPDGEVWKITDVKFFKDDTWRYWVDMQWRYADEIVDADRPTPPDEQHSSDLGATAPDGQANPRHKSQSADGVGGYQVGDTITIDGVDAVVSGIKPKYDGSGVSVQVTKERDGSNVTTTMNEATFLARDVQLRREDDAATIAMNKAIMERAAVEGSIIKLSQAVVALGKNEQGAVVTGVRSWRKLDDTALEDTKELIAVTMEEMSAGMDYLADLWDKLDYMVRTGEAYD